MEHTKELDLSEIPETDILFECPHCGKSLSIDPRGAGLVIRCTQCQKPVTVPIPEGMEIEDFDATPEELSAQLLHTRQVLAKTQSELKELEAEVVALRAFREEARAREAQQAVAMAPFRNGLAAAVRIQEDALAQLTKASKLAAEAFGFAEQA